MSAAIVRALAESLRCQECRRRQEAAQRAVEPGQVIVWERCESCTAALAAAEAPTP